MKDKRTIGALVALALIFFVTVGAVGAQVAKERIKWLVADKATFLEGGVEFYSDVSFGDGSILLDDGTAAAPGLAWVSDSDTGLYRPGDNQMGVSMAGVNVQTWKEFGSSTITTDTTTNLWEIADTTNVMTGGTNSLAAVNVDLAIGNSTGGTNNVYGVLIDSITQDAQNTETAIAIGNGWDRGLDMDGNSIYLDNDQDTIIAEASDDKISFTPGAAAGGLNILTGNLWVGNGTPDSTPNGEDAYVEGGLEVDGQTRLDGNAYVPDDGLLAFGASNDAYFWYDETTSDEFKLTIASATGGMEVQVGNVWIGNGTPGTASMNGEDLYVEGELEVDGAITLDGAATVNNNLVVTGTSDLQGSVSDSGGDLTFADNVVITGTTDAQGNVADSAGDYTIADNAIITGTLNGQGAADFDSTLNVDGTSNLRGNVYDSAGDFTIADAAVVTSTLNVQGATDLDTTLNVDGASTLHADASLIDDTTGGNQGARVEYIGLPRVKFVDLGAGTNGTTETSSYVDDSPTGEYAPIDADVTEAEGSVDGVYKFGSSSYKASFADTATSGDGFKATIAGDDLEANESIGLLLYSSVTIASGDLQILLTDDGGARNFDIGAITTANRWTWLEVDISSLAAGTGDVVTEFGVTLTAQGEGALGAFDLYLDVAYKWDADDEEALSSAIVQDGVINVLSIPTAAGTNNTWGIPVEGTDYFVHYESGNDFIVWISDQSTNEILAYVAY